jgi:hypothetical protein
MGLIARMRLLFPSPCGCYKCIDSDTGFLCSVAGQYGEDIMTSNDEQEPRNSAAPSKWNPQLAVQFGKGKAIRFSLVSMALMFAVAVVVLCLEARHFGVNASTPYVLRLWLLSCLISYINLSLFRRFWLSLILSFVSGVILSYVSILAWIVLVHWGDAPWRELPDIPWIVALFWAISPSFMVVCRILFVYPLVVLALYLFSIMSAWWQDQRGVQK